MPKRRHTHWLFSLNVYGRAIAVVIALVVGRLLLSNTTNTIHRPLGLTLQLNAPVHEDTIDGHKVLWRTPSSKPQAILFVAHGCSHAATDWFTGCKAGACIGLPEELAIVQLATERNMLVVAMSSLNRVSKCWSLEDGPVVASVLIKLQEQWGGAPIFAFGASSGGSFVASVLPNHIPTYLKGYICQIAPPPRQPTSYAGLAVFISMNRDARVSQAVEQYMQAVTDQKQRRRAHHIRLDPLRVDADFFLRRIANSYNQSQSASLVQALSFMIDKDEYLVEDPRRSDQWREALAALPFVEDSLVPDESPISEVLNVAWGQHEMSRDGVTEALDFLLSG